MDQRQEMMDDAIDDATGMEDEEESEDVVNQVLDEIGIDLGQAVRVVLHGASVTLMMNSLERRRVDCRRTQWRKERWRKRLEVEMRTMTTYRPGWTV